MEHDVIVEWKRNLSWNWPEWNNRVTSMIWVSSDSPSGIFAIYGFQKSSKYVFFFCDLLPNSVSQFTMPDDGLYYGLFWFH